MSASPSGTVRIAFLDSGVNPDGAGIDRSRLVTSPKGGADVLGHGTAAAATIQALAQKAVVLDLQVFARGVLRPVGDILQVWEQALEESVDIINLGFGTTDLSWRSRCKNLVERSREQGARVVAPAFFLGLPSLPGALSGADGVMADPGAPDGNPVYDQNHGFWRASPWPASERMPGRGPHGVSIAVARVSGYVARRLAERDLTTG